MPLKKDALFDWHVLRYENSHRKFGNILFNSKNVTAVTAKFFIRLYIGWSYFSCSGKYCFNQNVCGVASVDFKCYVVLKSSLPMQHFVTQVRCFLEAVFLFFAVRYPRTTRENRKPLVYVSDANLFPSFGIRCHRIPWLFFSFLFFPFLFSLHYLLTNLSWPMP